MVGTSGSFRRVCKRYPIYADRLFIRMIREKYRGTLGHSVLFFFFTENFEITFCSGIRERLRKMVGTRGPFCRVCERYPVDVDRLFVLD